MRCCAAPAISVFLWATFGVQPCYAAEKGGEVKTVDWHMAPEKKTFRRQHKTIS